jgi:hypothetical protein
MSTSRTAQRFATIFFLLAGLLLLKKPFFGETASLIHPQAAVQTSTPFQPVSLPSFALAKTNPR